MRYSWARLGLVLLIGIMHHSAPYANEAAGAARAHLIERIKSAETLHRDDLLEDAASRLRRIDPDSPEALLAQVYLAVRRNKVGEARELSEQLQRRAAGTDAAKKAAALLRLASPSGQEALAQARLYGAVGRLNDAVHAYDDVLQGVYPTADLALEYWQLRARIPEDRSAALVQLSRTLEDYPHHPGLLLALANHMFTEGRSARALAYLNRLGQIPGQQDAAASREYEYLAELPITTETAAALSDFLKRYAGTATGKNAQQLLDDQNRLLNDPIWSAGKKAVAVVDQGNGKESISALRSAVAKYPTDPQFLGALGLAYLRAGNRPEALRYFRLAREHEPRIDQASRWVSLIDSTEYWLLLEQASDALGKKNWDRARQLYQQAQQRSSSDLNALIGLGDSYLGEGQISRAWDYYQRALLASPSDPAALRAVQRYVTELPPEQALLQLDRLPQRAQTHLSSVHRQITLRRLQLQADEAEARQDWQSAITALTAAQELDLADPWLSFRLASILRYAGQDEAALTAYSKHLNAYPGSAVSLYAYALLLESLDRWDEGRQILRRVDRSQWTDEMAALHERLTTRMRIAYAEQLFAAGKTAAAIEYLEQEPQNTSTRLQVADWAMQTDQLEKALSTYEAVLSVERDNTDAQLGTLEAQLGLNRLALVRRQLYTSPPVPDRTDIGARRRLALLWAAIGDNERAEKTFLQAASDVNEPEPLLFRDYARLISKTQPKKALELYARAMADAGMLPADRPVENAEELTSAMLTPDLPDGWLRQSIRSDAADLYLSNNPTLVLSNDTWVRNDGTPGLSRLHANTTILQLDFPVLTGNGFLRADHIRMDAGDFDITDTGSIDERFGSCVFSGADVSGVTQDLPGCSGVAGQRASGTAFALGWRGDRFSFDLGRTPSSFTVSNWTGGISLRGDAGSVGWGLTLSRRPMSNSLLSLAGATDPRTGISWGGVLATGATANFSWDQGEADGVWLSLGHHRLTGHNVADNKRTRIMGGYYYRLINKPNEQLSVGVNAMHWRYERDLSNYTLGQGGYYSPQRYSSLSLPLSYYRRTENWAVALQASVSRSTAKTSDELYYPSAGLIAGPLQAIAARGVTAGGLAAANVSTGGTSSAWGYSLRGAAERRLSSHWVAGASIDIQHGQDYAPSRFMLYLRYTFQPWKGDLKLQPAGLTPYVDFE